MEPAGQDQPGRDFAARAVHDYSAELHRYLRRRVAEAQDLGDLVQEVYLRLLRVQSIETVRNPLAYIYGIAAHVASECGLEHQFIEIDNPA